MLSVSTLIDQLNALIASGSLTEEQLLQAFGAVESLEQKGVFSVYYEADLPSAITNEGRFVYIQSIGKYTYSNGNTWNINNILIPTDVNAYAWGNNTNFKLGDGTTTVRSSPVSVLGGFTDWTQIVTSLIGNHTIGIRANGTAWAWGNNGFGQLGDNTTVSKSSPVSVVGGFTDWTQVSIGDSHTLLLRANGTAWAIGINSYGRLGDNTTVSKSSPVSVVGGFTDWVQVSAGGNNSAAVRGNGSIWTWGRNNNGQLGDNVGATLQRSSPVSVVGGFTDWIQVSAGNFHVLALRANGTAWGWGLNTYGRIGDNATVTRSSPVSVVGGFTDWTQVSAGNTHSLGLRANGTAWGWGRNTAGQLGDNLASTGSRSSPVSVVGGFTDWIQVSAGSVHSAGIRANGTAWTWGTNTTGQLGDNLGTTTLRSSPVSIAGGFTDWIQINAGTDNTVAVSR